MTILLNGKSTDIENGGTESLHELLAGLGFRLNAPCGGCGRCGKCRVLISNAKQPTETDLKLLSAEDIAAGVRLACATAPFQGMDAHFEQEGERPAHIATEGKSVQYEFSPQIVVMDAVLSEPALADQASDFDRLESALGMAKLEASREQLAQVSAALRQEGWKAAAVLKGNRLLGLNPAGLYGAAVDIGTTTLASYLVDLRTGAQVAVASSLNPQRAWGDDVISRCDAARSGNLEDLQKSVAAEIDSLIGRMCEKAGVGRADVYHAVFAGNTVMMHLFAGVSPENIAVSPFIPAFTHAFDAPARELGVRINPEGVATLLPGVAAYVGADIVSGMLAAGMNESSEPSLLIDIGTNGEIALAAGGRLYACSTAAGPAFEGAHIACGMGGVAGAINTATFGNGIRFTTIGDEVPPRGICGSGLLDLVAGLLDCGAVDDTGRIDEDSAPSWIEIDQGKIILDREHDIYVSGRDIREVQLAKGAIAAGVEVLLREAGIKSADVRHVWLAGGFGSYMDRRSACHVGLIPMDLLDRTAAIGNSSGAGAKAALLSADAMKEAERLSKAVEYIELSARKDFQDLFMEKMMF